MSKQLTVRLADDLVDFIDQRVGRGEAASRAVVVASAVDKERRREIAERDAAILSEISRDEDLLDELAAFAARRTLDDLA